MEEADFLVDGLELVDDLAPLEPVDELELVDDSAPLEPVDDLLAGDFDPLLVVVE